ncbi:type III-B CRISPR module RAMP protein Cmr4 [Nocardiopsis sp. HNM0947]|uniref:Type III-B CRISPR module RAMP protein Cmr4 n=1 Tax=Nocardiopsis coralli TaxID=2772213 RepID=A0ABR9PBA5_9ACTN|nr:type III-B CRISPR module RAMP protein Cmr4 [Nocardiopsis coralli]MBE3001110.1 type III-B CRISPR module RAMP protein Cmr4 [Nocardiopsis coralli]
MRELLIYFYAESPVHAGASNAEADIDLPIQREKHSRYPVIYGQSLKGALRNAAEARFTDDELTRCFGSAPNPGGSTTPGLVSVGDAQLVAMPVPTLRRTFAWVTSTVALGRLARKYRALGLRFDLPVPKDPDKAHAPAEHWMGEQVLGPISMQVKESGSTSVSEWADRIGMDALPNEEPFAHIGKKLNEDLILVPSDAMSVLVEESTEVSVRVQLDKYKTVAAGPFHSEYLPTESLLAATVTLHEDLGLRDAANVKELLGGSSTELHQIGGDESIGKGLMWTHVVDGGDE